jgi:hypothetical protein
VEGRLAPPTNSCHQQEGGTDAPQVEVDTLKQVVEDADLLADMGAVARGALLLAQGLQRVRAIEEPWGAELAWLYQQAVDDYAERNRMKTTEPGLSLWRVMLPRVACPDEDSAADPTDKVG